MRVESLFLRLTEQDLLQLIARVDLVSVMKSRLCSLAMFLSFGCVANAQIAYQFVDIEALTGIQVSSINAVSDNGILILNGNIAYNLLTGEKISLAVIGTGYQTWVSSINKNGIATGTARMTDWPFTKKALSANALDPTSIRELATLPGFPLGQGIGISDANEIVGTVALTTFWRDQRAAWFQYDALSATYQPKLLSDKFSVAVDINSSNQIVGYAGGPDISESLPAMFDVNGGVKLLKMPLTAPHGQASVISDSGAIAGYGDDRSIFALVPLLWRSPSSAPEILPTPLGNLWEAYVTDMTDPDTIVGLASGDAYFREPILWKSGTPHRIQHFTLDFPGPQFRIETGIGISKTGVIVGTGTERTNQGSRIRDRGFLLVPTSRPQLSTTSGRFTLRNWSEWKSPGNFSIRVIPQYGEEEVFSVPIGRDGTYSFSSSLFGTATFEVSPPPPFMNRRFVGGINGLDHQIQLLNGDANGDQSVDLLDYFALNDSYNLGLSDPNFNPNADFTGDGSVDSADYSTLVAMYGRSGDF